MDKIAELESRIEDLEEGIDLLNNAIVALKKSVTGSQEEMTEFVSALISSAMNDVTVDKVINDYRCDLLNRLFQVSVSHPFSIETPTYIRNKFGRTHENENR